MPVPEPNRGLTVKEYNLISNFKRTANRFSLKLAKAETIKEQEEIEAQIDAASEKYEHDVFDIVAKCYNISKDTIDNMPNKDFMEMFEKLYNMSTHIPKNSELQSQSSSSSTTQTQPQTPA